MSEPHAQAYEPRGPRGLRAELWSGPAAFQAAAEAAAAPLDPPSDVHGSSAYRRHLVTVLVRRALAQAWERAGEQQRG